MLLLLASFMRRLDLDLDLRILTWKNHPQNKTPEFTNCMNMDICVVGITNPLFVRASQTETNFFKKIK